MTTTAISSPENIQVTQKGSGLEIVWKWSETNWIMIGIALVVIGWLMFSVLRFEDIQWASVFDDVVRSVTTGHFPFNLFGPVIF